jgi:formate dehydrogenase subunit gamma
VESSTARLDAIIDEHAGREGPLLPVLHDIQAEFGCIDEFAKRHVAKALNLSRAEVHGVVSFYHDFTEHPEPRPVIKLCRAEACQARGVEALVPAAEALCGGRVKLETVYCLGLCASGPSALVRGRPVARLTADKLAALIEAA